MKITVYNDRFQFSEMLTQSYIDDYMLHEVDEFDCLIIEITPNHPFAYGWLESFGQGISDLFYSIDFTHIKFEK